MGRFQLCSHHDLRGSRSVAEGFGKLLDKRLHNLGQDVITDVHALSRIMPRFWSLMRPALSGSRLWVQFLDNACAPRRCTLPCSVRRTLIIEVASEKPRPWAHCTNIYTVWAMQ